MKKLYLILPVCVVLASCSGKDSSESVQPKAPTSANADSSIEPVDVQTRMLMEEVKHIQSIFSGKQKVYNADRKLLKEIEIDEDGNINGSNIYKRIRIWHHDTANRLILLKGTDEMNSDRDTFELEEKTGEALLYKSLRYDDGSRKKGVLMYIFQKQ